MLNKHILQWLNPEISKVYPPYLPTCCRLKLYIQNKQLGVENKNNPGVIQPGNAIIRVLL